MIKEIKYCDMNTNGEKSIDTKGLTLIRFLLPSKITGSELKSQLPRIKENTKPSLDRGKYEIN